MLAVKYEESDVSPAQWRVLRRIGARDIYGVRRALKMYNVDTVDDLITYLKHHDPEPDPRARFLLALGRLSGGYLHDPHIEDIRREFRTDKNMNKRKILRDRIASIKNDG